MAFWNWLTGRRTGQQRGTAGRWLPVTDDRDEQYDVFPAALRPWAEEQLRFQAAHYAPESHASGPYPRAAAPDGGIAALRIPMVDAIAALSSVLDRFDGVLPPGDVPSTGPAAFGPSALTAVMLGHDGKGMLADIELILHGNIREEEMLLLSGLAALPASQPLIVVDWQFSRIARLDSHAELRSFLSL